VEVGPRSCPPVRGVIHALPLFPYMVVLVRHPYDGERTYIAEHVINYSISLTVT
jgi:hypothetical protein